MQKVSEDRNYLAAEGECDTSTLTTELSTCVHQGFIVCEIKKKISALCRSSFHRLSLVVSVCREHSYEGMPYDSRPPYIPELGGFPQPSPFAGKQSSIQCLLLFVML